MHLVGFMTLRGDLSFGAPFIHIGLQLFFVDREAGRKAVDHAANERTVAFAKSR